ncbi:MAG TPA: SusC/RagA family TonB-linked outer membrane protein [Puia sp.]|nr:SusC/RagA family TonB-linked outer membrane protein [Puia sp.]
MGKFLTLLAILVLYTVHGVAQTKVFTGRVTDPQGQPVAFASIKVKGQKSGVAADADGSYSIHAKAGDVLSVSGTGYVSREVVVGETSSLNIQMVRSSVNLTEVVVTALGQTQSKAKIGYSAQTFKTDAITKNGVTGALDGLQGKVAGADISNVGGPGSSTKVVLRSYGIIGGGNNQPLYVIDGVPMSDGNFQSAMVGDDGADYGNGMNNVNPSDIESVTILKGTAASSLYGGLAKNGAIMITTKKGRTGKLRIEVTSSANFSKVGKLPDYQTEFGQGWGGVFVPGENGSWGPKLDGKERLWGSVVDNSQLLKPFSAIKDPLKQFYTTGHEYNNTVALSGGSEITRFYFSYGNVSSVGIIPENANTQQRNTFALRTNSNFGKFSINTSMNYVSQALKVPNTGQGTSSGGGVFQSLLQIPVDLPIHDFRDINNKFFNTDNYFTPYAENPYFGLFNNSNQQKLDRFFGNLDLGYKFTSELSAELRIGTDVTNARTFEWKNSAAAKPGSWRGPSPTNTEGFPATPDIGGVFQASDYFGLVNADAILKYTKDFGKDFTLDALGGANFYTTTQRSEATQITNLLVPGFYNLSNTTKPPTTTDGFFQRRRMGGYISATLGFRDQLYLTGNVREDWSSTLPIEKNSIFYPGANLSWVASQLLNSRNTVSYLKLRAAYGRTGSDPTTYLTRSQLGSGNISLGFGSLTVPFNGVSGYGISNQIANPALKPIFTDEVELGAEAKFLKDRIGLDVAVYDKKTKGQIFPVFIAPSSGYTTLVQNLGLVDNKGIELTLNVTPVKTNDFTWSFQYVFSRDWNKVVNLNGTAPDPLLFGFSSAIDAELRAVVGKTVASMYTGTPQLSDKGQIVVNPKTGYSIPNASSLDAFGHTKAYMGSALYDYTMGFSNTFQYKDFALNFSLDFRYGGVMFSETANLDLFVGNGIASTYNDRKPYIIPNSVVGTTDGSGKTTYTPNTTFIGASGNGQSDLYYNGYSESNSYSGQADKQRIIDRSFLKLRDVNLSYNLPKSWAEKVKASSASLAVYGRNFLLWVPKSNVYVDPEATNAGNDLGGEYGELNAAPLAKSYGVTLKVVF